MACGCKKGASKKQVTTVKQVVKKRVPDSKPKISTAPKRIMIRRSF